MIKEPPPAWDTLVDSLSDLACGVVITDRAGNVWWVNDEFCRMTGYKPKEAEDCCPLVRPLGIHTGRSCASFWRAVLSGQVWEGEVRGRTKDGEEFPIRLSVAPLCDSLGRTTHLVALHEVVETGTHNADIRALEDALRNWRRLAEPAVAEPATPT